MIGSMDSYWRVTNITEDIGDIEDVSRLINESEQYYGLPQTSTPGVHQAIRANVSGPHSIAWLILARSQAGDPAGYVSSPFLWPSVGLERVLFLKELLVGAPFRRQGVGQRLLEATRQLAAAQGCNRLDWTAHHVAQSAVRFYEQLGIQRLKTKAFYRLDGDALRRPPYGR
jgi:GNAT superfamily N-acetyltransferase